MPDGAEAIRFPLTEPPEPGAAVEVAEGILWARLPLPMAIDHVNIFALDDGDGWTLIDTGLAVGRCRAAVSKLLDGALSTKPVTRVILTHHHPDHVGLVGDFVSRGAELWTTRTAYLMARMLVLDEQERPSAEMLAFWRDAGMPPEMLAQREAERPFNFADCVAPVPLGFTRLRSGDAVRAAGRTWDVRIGHGHAPEHLTLWSRDDAIVIGGDQLLPSISPNLGAYATEPGADPVGEWIDSCRSFVPYATDDQLVLPGHKLPYRGLPTRLVQMIDNHAMALDRLRAALSEPKRATECFQSLFGRVIAGDAYGLALVEAVGHLNHLLARGEAVRERGEDGAWLWRRT
ncbi:MBL fold metallo-hydrolase [Rhodobacterales bacterium HKCCE3408]|nr:MBL fold metallo-hydrolase [Rhodobacterales bacterium HKCCE3408]